MKRILLIILILLIVAQFFQPKKNAGVAFGNNDITHAIAVPDSVMAILKTSCYDCHSNHTNYPWYSRISPVNWWLNNHIQEGKEELNFTEFASYSPRKQAKKLDETAEMVQNKKMPLSSYTWIHTNAKLNDQQRQLVTDWADAASQQLGGGSDEKD